MMKNEENGTEKNDVGKKVGNRVTIIESRRFKRNNANKEKEITGEVELKDVVSGMSGHVIVSLQKNSIVRSDNLSTQQLSSTVRTTPGQLRWSK
jgi:hypothetical protein